jgi:hypothetical protein
MDPEEEDVDDQFLRSYHPNDLLFVATLLYAGLCLKKVLMIPSKGKSTKRQRRNIAMPSFSPLRVQGDNKISVNELRAYFLPLAEDAFNDRVRSMMKLKGHKSIVLTKHLTAARAATFAEWRAYDKESSSGHEVSDKTNELIKMRKVMEKNSASMYMLWGIPINDNTAV